jgi:hypothetical protein
MASAKAHELFGPWHLAAPAQETPSRIRQILLQHGGGSLLTPRISTAAVIKVRIKTILFELLLFHPEQSVMTQRTTLMCSGVKDDRGRGEPCTVVHHIS